MRRLFTVHIETPAGARFSHHNSEEEMRAGLVEYYNEVHADGSPIAVDTDLGEVIEAIEEVENVSWEESWVPDTLKLFFIGFPDDGRGSDLDAIVEAANAGEAQRLWAAQWEHDLTDPEAQQPRIWEIKPTGSAGVLGWNTKQLNRII